MSSVVVDTDVVSFIFKNHPIGHQYDSDLAGKTLILSFMTIAELDRWTIQSRWGEARRNWLRLYLEPFAILPYNRSLCEKWAEVTWLHRRMAIESNVRTRGSPPPHSRTACP
jgi:predicted nucleic acid-binding protein